MKNKTNLDCLEPSNWGEKDKKFYIYAHKREENFMEESHKKNNLMGRTKKYINKRGQKYK